jgi:hypothetical protein
MVKPNARRSAQSADRTASPWLDEALRESGLVSEWRLLLAQIDFRPVVAVLVGVHWLNQKDTRD